MKTDFLKIALKEYAKFKYNYTGKFRLIKNESDDDVLSDIAIKIAEKNNIPFEDVADDIINFINRLAKELQNESH